LFWFWQLFRERFKTKTHDYSEYAYNYMSGQLETFMTHGDTHEDENGLYDTFNFHLYIPL